MTPLPSIGRVASGAGSTPSFPATGRWISLTCAGAGAPGERAADTRLTSRSGRKGCSFGAARLAIYDPLLQFLDRRLGNDSFQPIEPRPDLGGKRSIFVRHFVRGVCFEKRLPNLLCLR